MGVDTSLYVGAKTHVRPTLEQIEALVNDLLEHDFVKMPCALMIGEAMRLDIPPSLKPPLWFPDNDLLHKRNDWPIKCPYANDYFFDEEVQKPEDVLVYYAGQSKKTLQETWRKLASQTEDICISFSGLTFDHGQTWEGGEVYIFSLAQPFPLVCSSAYRPPEKSEETTYYLQYVVSILGRYGIWEIDGTPLEPILYHHLGADLVVAASFA